MEKRQYHYSPQFWPNPPLPLPRVWPHLGTLTLDDAGWLIEDPNEAATARLRRAMGDEPWPAVPHEMHLRHLRAVDLRDPESIRAMAEQTGPLLNPEAPWRGMVSREMEDQQHIASAYHDQFVIQAASRYELPNPDVSTRPWGAVHIAEVAARVHRVRLLVDHVSAALEMHETAPIWRAEGWFDFPESYHVSLPNKRPIAAEDPETLAWHFFAECLNQGLFDVSPRVIVNSLDSDDNTDDVVFAFTAACVMVLNDLNDGTRYRVCQDETCQSLFKVQPGPHGGGSSRARGVLYCCALHARNQAQRERRRRDRADRAKER